MRKSGSKPKTKEIQFSLEASEAKKVSLVGEFNNWDPEADPMERDDTGTWTTKKKLPAGNLEYKFWIDGDWMPDPQNLRSCPNCYGTQNNIVKVIL